MNQNPYESPRGALEEKGTHPFWLDAPRVVVLGLMALGGLFLLSIIGEIVIDLIFPGEEPSHEPYFPPIHVNEE